MSQEVGIRAACFFPRVGQIVGTPENCREVLSREEPILVFPEGARGISKSFTQRYQLEKFGNGFMRLALENNTPIVPIAVIGAEEQAPAINVRPLAKLLGAPAFPLAATVLPLPLPVKYRLYFGEPMVFEGTGNEEDSVIAANVQQVMDRIAALIETGEKQRRAAS